MRDLAFRLLPFALIATAAQAYPLKLPPVEVCGSEPGFMAFRDRLRDVAARKDRQALLAMLAPDVTVNFGGGQGPEAFAEAWGLGGTGESDIWPLLRKILALGCAVSDEGFVMPSLTIQFEPEEDDDFFDTFVVASPAATLRSAPEANSKAIATLAWDVVKAVDQSRGAQTKVRLQDGREGWVYSEELYNPAYYRMFLQNRGGKWVIVAFVAGD